MNDDAELLRRYLEHASEEAFTALVHRHINLVYSAALRRTGGDPHRAADVTQDVFTALARQARALSTHPALSAWLHTATRNIAVNRMVSDERRQQRHVYVLSVATDEPVEAGAEWDRLRPVLDAAIDELPETDRRTVVMRFLERRPFQEIGATLSISEDAARVRTARALTKLRSVLVRRGITSTAEALATVVSVHATVNAPAGLAAAMAVQSLAVTGPTGAVSLLFAGKWVATVAISSAVAFGLGVLLAENRATGLGSASASQPQTAAFGSLTNENRQLEAELQRLNADADRLETANVELIARRERRTSTSSGSAGRIIGLPLQRYEIQERVVNNFRQLAAAQDQYKLEYGRWPTSLYDLVGGNNYVRGIVPVDGEDYADLMWGGRTFKLTTKSGVTIGYANDEPVDAKAPEFQVDYPPEVTRARDLENKLANAKQAATEAYRLANRGKNPPNEKLLIAFFANPEEGADFVEYLEVKKGLPED